MCIFCDIVKKKITAEIEFEDKKVLAFRDAHPIAPVHILIIPKKHIATINDLKTSDEMLAGHMILTARDIARKLKIAKDGYKLLFRTGDFGGQVVPHIHLHLIGGAKLREDIRPI